MATTGVVIKAISDMMPRKVFFTPPINYFAVRTNTAAKTS